MCLQKWVLVNKQNVCIVSYFMYANRNSPLKNKEISTIVANSKFLESKFLLIISFITWRIDQYTLKKETENKEKRKKEERKDERGKSRNCI